MNKVDRAWLDDLIQTTSDDLYEQAIAIYEELGASSVIEWGGKIGLMIEFCEPCDCETPTITNGCAVCGTARG